MTESPSGWTEMYATALDRYLADTNEEDREYAHALGRRLIAAGQGVIDLAELHGTALFGTLTRGTHTIQCAEITRRASEFLTEGLASFEMALRGFREASEALKHMNATLEERVSERTSDLLRLNAELRAVIESAPAGIIVLDSRLTVQWLNLIGAMQLGIADRASTIGRQLHETAPELRDRMPDLRRVLAGEELEFLGTRVPTPHGDRYFDVRYRPIRSDDAIIGVVGLSLDITQTKRAEQERVEIEKQLIAAQRMEAVGRLAGGVAHDFNNILTVIQSYSEFLRDSLHQADPLRDDVEVIRDAADRAARLTDQLLAFGRRQIQELTLMDINEVVADIDRMLRRLLGAHIELVTNMERALGSIKADRAQIEQILMNLAVNARDAMPHGGKLTIETKHVTHEGINGTVGVIPAGAYVLLAVTDTGTGMDEQILQNVFEPFFTTKEQGKGTGLGLSTVYGIVKQSQGFIHVDSAPGKGSSFEIYFPRVDAPADRPALRSLSKIADGTETVLLVEDEDLVRKAAARILERHGYHVIIAAHGEDALRKAEQYQGTIDLLLTDVAMPGMSGTTLAERLAPKHPEMRVAYMSGYTEDPLVHADNDLAYVRKPFTPDRLLRKIRGVLDRAKRADR